MSEPSLALQGAIVATLKADAPTTALIAGRIYDRVPDAAVFPYVTVGEDQVLADAAECLEGSVEIFALLHVWSRKPGKPEAKSITGAIVRRLNTAELALAPDYRLVTLNFDGARHLDDPDGLTSHSVVTFRALVDEVTPTITMQAVQQFAAVQSIAAAANVKASAAQLLAMVQSATLSAPATGSAAQSLAIGQSATITAVAPATTWSGAMLSGSSHGGSAVASSAGKTQLIVGVGAVT